MTPDPEHQKPKPPPIRDPRLAEVMADATALWDKTRRRFVKKHPGVLEEAEPSQPEDSPQ